MFLLVQFQADEVSQVESENEREYHQKKGSDLEEAAGRQAVVVVDFEDMDVVNMMLHKSLDANSRSKEAVCEGQGDTQVRH